MVIIDRCCPVHTMSRGHVDILAPTVRELYLLEKQCQQNYLQLLHNGVKQAI